MKLGVLGEDSNAKSIKVSCPFYELCVGVELIDWDNTSVLKSPTRIRLEHSESNKVSIMDAGDDGG